jgi:hypothetical protein
MFAVSVLLSGVAGTTQGKSTPAFGNAFAITRLILTSWKSDKDMKRGKNWLWLVLSFFA